jgi:S-adenosyl methyltransferase
MVNRYVKALGPGSYAILSVGRSSGEQSERFMNIYRTDGAPRMHHYTTADISALFASLEMVPPGLTAARAWRPDGADLPAPPQRPGDMLAGVARLRRATPAQPVPSW